MSNSLEAFFCHVDDFCKIFEPKWQQLANAGKWDIEEAKTQRPVHE
jgi:hypothetical protein